LDLRHIRIAQGSLLNELLFSVVGCHHGPGK
jgi:hypothetical protein